MALSSDGHMAVLLCINIWYAVHLFHDGIREAGIYCRYVRMRAVPIYHLPGFGLLALSVCSVQVRDDCVSSDGCHQQYLVPRYQVCCTSTCIPCAGIPARTSIGYLLLLVSNTLEIGLYCKHQACVG